MYKIGFRPCLRMGNGNTTRISTVSDVITSFFYVFSRVSLILHHRYVCIVFFFFFSEMFQDLNGGY